MPNTADIKEVLRRAKTAPRIPGVRRPYPTVTLLASDIDALVEEIERLREALVMYDDKARDIQDYWGDPSSYTHNALLTAQLVHGDTVASARAAIAAAEAAGITTE